MDSLEARKLLNQEVLATAKSHYAEVMQTWAALDKKAESTISVSGIFLAAVFAFAKELSSKADLFDKLLLVFVVLLLVFVVILSILVLRVKSSRMAPTGNIVNDVVKCIFSGKISEGDIPLASLKAFVSLSRLWDDAGSVALGYVEKKAKIIKRAHMILLLAIVCVAVVVVRKIII